MKWNPGEISSPNPGDLNRLILGDRDSPGKSDKARYTS